VLGGAAHAARPSIFPGVAARKGDVETMMRRGRFARARLPMWSVHDFRHGTSDAILPLRGADRVHGRRRSRGLGGIPGRIHGSLLDRGVGVGQLAPALQRIRAVARLPFVVCLSVAGRTHELSTWHCALVRDAAGVCPCSGLPHSWWQVACQIGVPLLPS
jgi:hypothetical protein